MERGRRKPSCRRRTQARDAGRGNSKAFCRLDGLGFVEAIGAMQVASIRYGEAKAIRSHLDLR